MENGSKPPGREEPPTIPVEDLTAAEEAAATRSSRPPPDATAGREGSLILLVEDDDDNREMLSMLLGRRGFHVRAVANGVEALFNLKEKEPLACLIDLGLPDIDGYELCRRARSMYGDRILLIALTGYGHAEAKKKTKEVGFDAHLTKPVDLRRLVTLLSERVGKKQGRGPSPPPC